MKTIQVTAAIIVDADKRVLISLRHDRAHQGGLWEFPGGKVELGESAEQALTREIKEELGLNIDIDSAELFHREQHQYAELMVDISFYWLEKFSGEAQGLESQKIQWANACTLKDLNFPDANHSVLQKVIAQLNNSA